MNVYTPCLRPQGINEWKWPLVFAVLPPLCFAAAQVVNPIFIVALVITVGCVLVALFRPLSGFFCYAVSIQFVDYFKRLLLLFGVPSSTEWYGMLLLPDVILMAALAGTLFYSENQSQVDTRKYLLVANAIAVYISWYSIRSVWTEAPLVNSLGKWKLVIPYFTCFYIGKRLLANRDALRRLLQVLAASVGLAAIYGVCQLLFGLTSFEERWLYEGYTHLELPTLIYGDGNVRAFSFYSDADTFASTIACVGTLLAFSRRMFGRFWWNSWFLLGLMGAALVASLVRAGWVHALLGAGIYFWTRSTARPMRKILILLILVGLLASGIFWAVSALTNLESPFLARALVTGTYNSRTIGYQNLFQMGIISFVVGRGVATMPGSVKDISGMGVDNELLAHDLVSDLLYEIGWIGFGLFGVIILRSLMGPGAKFLSEMGPAVKYVVWSIPLIGMLFGGSIIAVRPVTTLLWTSVGMLCASNSGE